jgi:hypothetical protein
LGTLCTVLFHLTSRYGAKKSSQPINVDGPVLHALELGFVHPKTNKNVLFKSEIPSYIQDILNKFTIEEY